MVSYCEKIELEIQRVETVINEVLNDEEFTGSDWQLEQLEGWQGYLEHLTSLLAQYDC